MSPAKKILLIEDEPEFRMALRIRLEANGYEVIEAEDGVVGLDMARNKNPDLIMLDIMLPKMDGYKVARLLKFDEKYRKIQSSCSRRGPSRRIGKPGWPSGAMPT